MTPEQALVVKAACKFIEKLKVGVIDYSALQKAVEALPGASK